MEGMRGFAALLVFSVHFHSLFEKFIADRWVYIITKFAASIGHVGVDLFFVLSGFLIYGIILRPQFHFFKYLLRRIRRLYPVFIFVLTIYVILSFAFPEQSKLPDSLKSIFAYLLANLAMLPGMTSIKPIITVAWSLSYEWFLYLMLPMLVSGLAIRKWKHYWRVVFFIMVVSFYSVACSLGIGHHPRLILFAAGMLIWEFRKSNSMLFRLPKWGEPVASISFIVVLVLIGVSKLNSGPVELILSRVPGFYSPLLFITLFFLVSYGLFVKGTLCSFFSWTPLRWVGNMSYSYYLIHGLTLQGLNLMLSMLFPGLRLYSFMLFVTLLVGLTATIAVSCILYLLIEKPLSINK
jgi:exopolysaccharide production protein ExoZ